MMTEPCITVQDQDGLITLSRADLLKYTGPANPIAVALMLRLCAYAFARLAGEEAPHRRELYWQVGFPGPGILDCIEMISHAVREGRCLQNPSLRHPEAPWSLGGQFIFDISYRGKTLRVWPDASVFDDTFRSQVARWQDADEAGREAFLRYKADKVATIMQLEDAALFHHQWLQCQ